MNASAEAVRLSVVLPVYRNRTQLPELHRRLSTVAQALTSGYELLFVEDDGQDGALEWLEACAARDPHVRLLPMERNIGQHRAVLAGLVACTGALVAVMDADLQDTPEDLAVLVQALGERPAIVFAQRTSATDASARRLSGRLFKRLVRLTTSHHPPPGTGMFFVASRAALEAAFARSRNTEYVPLWLAQSGYAMGVVPVDRCARPSGISAYSWAARLRLGVRAMAEALRARHVPRR